MFIANAFDDNKKVDGVWADFGGARFKIASSRSTKYVKAISRLMRPVKKQIQNSTLSPEENESLLCAAMAEGLLLDWEGVGRIDEASGKAVAMEYSVDNAKQVLQENYELREFVSEFADSLDNFKREYVEGVVKK
jgi:hypothetical protein